MINAAEQSMDSSAGSTTTDRSSNLSCSPTPPKSALTPPSISSRRSSNSPPLSAVAIGLNPNNNNNNNNNNINNSNNSSSSSSANHHHHHHHHHNHHHHTNTTTVNSRISQNSPIMSMSGSGHQLSPPHVSTPNSLVAAAAAAARLSNHPNMTSLPPSLGLLNSLSNMVHHSPLDLMHHPHMPPRSYNSPPPISTSDPTENECKLVDYRGHKVAAFTIRGSTMLCLPQAFELFLKHLVGGLHTVYTKLKRLDIVPIVCNVEQVRILRGLGAIQPGVNRCKLLSCKDFDVLYRDCTTARCMMSHKATDGSRPGRPPKRASSVGLSIAASHLSQLKKHRENGDYISNYENGHLSSVDGSRLEKSPLLANGYNHPPTHLNHMQQFIQFNHHPAAAAHAAAALLSHQGLPPPPHPGLGRSAHDAASILKGQPLPPATMDALTRSGIWENCRAAYEDIVKHLERLREDQRNDPDRILSLENKPRDLSSRNGSSPGGHSPVLNLSKNGGDHSGSDGEHTVQEEPEDDVDSISENEEDDEKDNDLSDNPEAVRAPSNSSAGISESASQNDTAINYSGSAVNNISGLGPGGLTNPTTVQDNAISSTETLLRNIQGLLKVAADNARQQERQISYEKAELKMDILREREVKESLERQLSSEQKIRVLYEKRYKKERRVRKHIQEQLELEAKRRTQLEEAIKTSCTSSDALRVLNAAVEYSTTNEKEKDRDKDGQRNSGTEHSDSSTYSNPTTNAHQLSQPSSADTTNEKPWNYSNMDIMNSGAAFWQNYSESLAQELELERKSRHQHLQQQSQHIDGSDSKSPLQDSRSAANYYKNSVLFSTAT